MSKAFIFMILAAMTDSLSLFACVFIKEKKSFGSTTSVVHFEHDVSASKRSSFFFKKKHKGAS